MPPAAQRMLFVINVIAKFAESYEIMHVFEPEHVAQNNAKQPSFAQGCLNTIKILSNQRYVEHFAFALLLFALTSSTTCTARRSKQGSLKAFIILISRSYLTTDFVFRQYSLA